MDIDIHTYQPFLMSFVIIAHSYKSAYSEQSNHEMGV